MSIFSQLAQASDYYTDYDYSTDYGSSTADGAAAAVVGGVFILFMLFTLVISYVVSSFLLSRIFKKAGVEQWIAWVPFYNNWKLLEIGGQQGFWAILVIVPFVNIVSVIFTYIAMYRIGLKLQKEGWFVLLAIFLPIVWYIWLAFDSSKWQGAGAPVVAGTSPEFVADKKKASDSKAE
jgi:hypothetical protein